MIPLNCPHGSRVQHTPFLVFREVQNDVATVKREICSLDAGVLFAQEACSWVYGVNDIAKRNPSNLRTSLTLHPAPCTLRPTPYTLLTLLLTLPPTHNILNPTPYTPPLNPKRVRKRMQNTMFQVSNKKKFTYEIFIRHDQIPLLPLPNHTFPTRHLPTSHANTPISDGSQF